MRVDSAVGDAYEAPRCTLQYGQAGDPPVVGDWDGDGIDTVGFSRNEAFYLRSSNTTGDPKLIKQAVGKSRNRTRLNSVFPVFYQQAEAEHRCEWEFFGGRNVHGWAVYADKTGFFKTEFLKRDGSVEILV